MVFDFILGYQDELWAQLYYDLQFLLWPLEIGSMLKGWCWGKKWLTRLALSTVQREHPDRKHYAGDGAGWLYQPSRGLEHLELDYEISERTQAPILELVQSY